MSLLPALSILHCTQLKDTFTPWQSQSFDGNKCNEDMLLKCHVNVSFWQGVEKWNAKLSETELNLSSNRIIVGDV